MTAIVLVSLFLAVVIGLAFVFGGALLALLLALAGLAALGWLVLVGFSKRSPREVAEQAHEREFLGPGGPDDPNA